LERGEVDQGKKEEDFGDISIRFRILQSLFGMAVKFCATPRSYPLPAIQHIIGQALEVAGAGLDGENINRHKIQLSRFLIRSRGPQQGQLQVVEAILLCNNEVLPEGEETSTRRHPAWLFIFSDLVEQT